MGKKGAFYASDSKSADCGSMHDRFTSYGKSIHCGVASWKCLVKTPKNMSRISDFESV